MEHAVIVHLRLQGGEFGSEQEHEAIEQLTEALDEAIVAYSLGEFDGESSGEAVASYTCTVRMRISSSKACGRS